MSDTADPIDPVDQQLIDLLNEKPPEELSFEELDLLRQRLSESPALRAALAEHLQTESYLAQVLGNVSISPETIITRAKAEQAAEARPWQWIVGGGICLLLVVALGAVFMNAMRGPEERPIADVVKPKELDKPQVEQPRNPEVARPEEQTQPEIEVGPQLPKVNVTLGAEKFVRGTVKIDNAEYGSPTNIVVHSGGLPKRTVEYEIDLPRAGEFFLHLRYASGEERPVKVTLNGKNIEEPLAGKNSGGYYPQQQKWFTEGKFAFKKGRNLLKFSREGLLPHFNRLVISTEPTISDATAPKPPPDELAQAEPWAEALKDPDPPSYLVKAFDEFDTDKSIPTKAELLRWFSTIPGQPSELRDTQKPLYISAHRQTTPRVIEFNGVFRLRWPWQENAALRLAIENNQRGRMHFYTKDNEGVTLVYYPDEGYAWAAYTTKRKDGNTHAPEIVALTATDEGRATRTEYRLSGSPIDLRWHAGELLLMRGDIVLLRAPLKELPKDVFFEGKIAFFGIGVAAAKDAPAAEKIAPPQEMKPADLAWEQQFIGDGKLTKNADGSVELLANDAKKAGFVTVPLGLTTPSEIILEMEASPGAGVYVCPKRWKNGAMVRIIKNQRTNSLCAMRRGDEFREGDVGYWHERVAVHVPAERQFIKLTPGAGMVRHAVSSDGRHWAEWEEPSPYITHGASHLCLDFTTNTPHCRLKLHKISIRPLPAVADLADPALLTKVPVLTDVETPSIGQWLATVTDKQPQGVDTGAWRRTCAVRSLAAGCNPDLGQRLLSLLLEDAEARQLSIENLLALYQQTFLLLETRHNLPQAQACWNRYVALAARASREGQRPYTTVRQAMMNSPVSWRHNLPSADDASVRLELVQLLYSSNWEATLQFCRMLQFFHQEQRSPLIEWAVATAARQLPGRAGGDSIARIKTSWRPLLVEELSKDAYNLLAEMQAILDSDAFDDAARMITSISPDAVTGVAPHGRDRQLLVSLPSAIRLAVREYPQLQQVMNEKFGPLAQLRVRQSVSGNNVAAVELASVQFEATEAAAEAHRWLGDRALSSGQFARAMAEYERALKTAPATLKHELSARMRLTAAMQGEDLGEPVTRPVIFGETTISPGEFETIVADVKKSNNANAAQRAVAANEQRTYPALSPQGFEAQHRGKVFDGDANRLGQSPDQDPTRDVNRLKIGWCERQLATVVEGNVLYVSNRFQIVAFNLDNGQRMWASATPGTPLKAREWSLIPMRPLVAGNFIYARLMFGAGPMLACFEKSTGKLIWTGEQRYNESLVSDPLLIQDQLVALTLTRSDQGQSTLRLTTFSRDSGEPIVQRNLARLNEVWWSRKAGEVTALDDGLLATLGGVSLCCDLNGNVRWIRRGVSMPPEEEPWVRQWFERPLLVGNQAILSQPGVRTVECVDVDTGRLAWSKTLPDIESAIGIHDSKLILRTESAFLALNAADGAELWRSPRPTDIFEATLLGGSGGMIYTERIPAKDKKRSLPKMVWLDLGTGAPQTSFVLPSFEESEPHIGPLVSYKDRVWAFYGKGNTEANRDLFELVPKGDAPLTPLLAATAIDPWSCETDPSLKRAAESLFAGWPLLAGNTNGETGLKDDVYGEKDVMGTVVRPDQPTLFAREFKPAAGSHPKVRLRINHRANQNFATKFSVQFAGETLWSQELNNDSNPQQWKDFEIDLSKAAGQSGLLVVRADYVSPQAEMNIWWKRVELVD